MPEQKEEIAKLLGKTKERIPELKDALGLVKEMSEKLADCKTTIAEEIKRNAKERVVALRDAEEKLLERLELIYTGKQKVLGLQRDGLELELGKISGCCEFAENVLKYENEVEILTIKNKLKNLSDVEVCEEMVSGLSTFKMFRLQFLLFKSHQLKLDPEEDDTIQYTADPEYLHTVSQSLGILHASSTFASLSFAVGDGISTARVKVEANFQVITKDRHGNRKEGGDRLNVVVRQPDKAILKAKVKDEGNMRFMVE